ncbi:hypothetical protein PAP_01015 [Palaeococcus pacificus DY20341]|uniref:DUF835 domain-containing protein n=1 Tax=Palaeococcus pacificus DY20341 TaxID=1343739 RepID=A0A075LPP8_9EURY|nr:DUF835 domain-containing protein [Palaeococcus pacificus]AIF68645.1 hypothetical protein PAP_01015 [Palaeococcus pacificus DY20341]
MAEISQMLIPLNLVGGFGILIVIYNGLKYRNKFFRSFNSLKRIYDAFLLGFMMVFLGILLAFYKINKTYTTLDVLLNVIILAVLLIFGLSWTKLVKNLVEGIESCATFYGEVKGLGIASGLYLCKDRDSCLNFSKSLLERFPSMIICRDPCEVLKKRLGFEDQVKCWWLTKVEGENVIHPTRLPFLTYNITEFINGEGKRFVLLDGIEYLVLENGFDAIYKFLTTLKDYAILYDSIILVPIDPEAYEHKEYGLLLREFEILEEKKALFSNTGNVYVF